jgi:hypothetical protein
MSGASFSVGWMTTPQKIHLGYDGLVPPGACVSTYFVYPLNGVQVGASLPIRLGTKDGLNVYGSYFIADSPRVNQEITWTNNPPGIRVWRDSDTEWHKVGGEALYWMSGQTALVGGFRYESLLTNFSDPDPNYIFTVSTMQAQTTITAYEPYVGIRLRQGVGPGGLSVQVVGFPYLFATIEHLNTCNNRGVPFAHTGRQTSSKGFFLEVSAECRFRLLQSMEVAGFVDWNVYQGHTPMTIERHEGGPIPAVTEATVSWSHRISSFTVGGKVEMSWNLPL